MAVGRDEAIGHRLPRSRAHVHQVLRFDARRGIQLSPQRQDHVGCVVEHHAWCGVPNLVVQRRRGHRYLLCQAPEGEKFAYALRTNVEVLSAEWLYEAVRTGTVPAPLQYSLRPQRTAPLTLTRTFTRLQRCACAVSSPVLTPCRPFCMCRNCHSSCGQPREGQGQGQGHRQHGAITPHHTVIRRQPRHTRCCSSASAACPACVTQPGYPQPQVAPTEPCIHPRWRSRRR